MELFWCANKLASSSVEFSSKPFGGAKSMGGPRRQAKVGATVREGREESTRVGDNARLAYARAFVCSTSSHCSLSLARSLAVMLCYVISAPRLCWREYLAPGI